MMTERQHIPPTAKTLAIICICAIALLLTACGKTLSGTYAHAANYTIDFNPNGTCVVQDNGMSWEGSYEYDAGSGTFKLKQSGLGGSVETYTFWQDGDNIVLQRNGYDFLFKPYDVWLAENEGDVETDGIEPDDDDETGDFDTEDDDSEDEETDIDFDNANNAKAYYYSEDGTLMSTSDGKVQIPAGHQAIGPVSEGLFEVRWLESVDDKWDVGTDGVFHYGFMNLNGEVELSVDKVLENLGLPTVNDEGEAIALRAGTAFVDDRAVLELRYGESGQNYSFYAVVDKNGKVYAYAGIDPSHMKAAGSDSLRYTSFDDPMKLENYPNVSLSGTYNDGVLPAGLNTSLGGDHDVLLNTEGDVHANFYYEELDYRGFKYYNSKIAVAEDNTVYRYSTGKKATRGEALLKPDDLAKAEDFDSFEVKGIFGSGTNVAITGTKETPAGKRTKCGIYDAQKGKWVSGPFLGGDFENVKGNCSSVTVSGGYSDELPDGWGLLLEDGTWLAEIGGDYADSEEDVEESGQLFGNIWYTCARIEDGSSDSTYRYYLFDSDHPELNPSTLVDIRTFGERLSYEGLADDESLLESLQ